ncbi:hypothetical protein HGM15179_007900 [Zosterops borbonicus]|uniref:Uncharacterized protein n=1 Tax=Zosterops borbonicus TaxID=364589 RepID=A0A8K1GIR6_9PASS|nr:hypothetical protein HGM15179_007900 [Zosterops borbonicus]
MMMRELDHLSSGERLGELELFSLEERRLWDDLIAAFQYLIGAYRKVGENPFTEPYSDRTRGNGFKLKVSSFGLDIWKKFHYCEGEALEQSAQRICGCPIPENVQVQVGWGSEQHLV